MEEFIRTYPLCRYIHARNGILVTAMNRRGKERRNLHSNDYYQSKPNQAQHQNKNYEYYLPEIKMHVFKKIRADHPCYKNNYKTQNVYSK